MDKSKNTLNEALLTIPSFAWLILFFLIPTFIIFAYAFKPSDIYGGVGEGWTLDTIKQLADPNYYLLIWRTLWLSCLTTAICLCLALPVGYQLATTTTRLRHLLLLLIVVPFWSSFLIRIFAWKALLHPEGIFKQFLVFIRLADPNATLLFNSATVLLVMVYTYLPFAVFPIYAAASKFNFQLIEGAMDLGASRQQAFFKIFVPGIRKGILTGMVMVFIPAIGAYVIPDLVGGVNSEMIGNKIAQRTFVERNLPQASALSALLALAVLVPVIAVTFLTRKAKRIEAEARNRE
jgi:spermidine/putrescine transport system permease protein